MDLRVHLTHLVNFDIVSILTLIEILISAKMKWIKYIQNVQFCPNGVDR